MTQQELANILNTTKNSISHWELGKTEPDIKTIKLLATFFKVSTDYLLGKSDIPCDISSSETNTIKYILKQELYTDIGLLNEEQLKLLKSMTDQILKNRS